MILVSPTVFFAQDKDILFQESFEQGISQGIKGSAFDLGKTSNARKPMLKQLVDKDVHQTFSIEFWVNAEDDWEQYELLALEDTAIDSIKSSMIFGKQPNGAWYWEYRNSQVQYSYRPTRTRQSIFHKWNLIGISYLAEKQEVWLYYNGKNVAIYHIPGANMLFGNKVTIRIGGKIKGDMDEWEAFNGMLDEMVIRSSYYSPNQMAEIYSHYYPSVGNNTTNVKSLDTLKVMTFNIWDGGKETGKYIGPQRVVDLIKSQGADIVAMQETYGSGEQIADALGYYFYLRSNNLSIMSRYPIEATLKAYKPFYSAAAQINVNGNTVFIASNWLNYPIDYWDMIEKGKPIDTKQWMELQKNKNAEILKEILEVLSPQVSKDVPFIFCGDFNSGSHLDWIDKTRHLNGGYVMAFPTTRVMEAEGFTDSFRERHPDPLKERGITWTPANPAAFQDRIDYIFYKGKNIKALASEVVNKCHIKYPSDHGAVVTTFKISN